MTKPLGPTVDTRWHLDINFQAKYLVPHVSLYSILTVNPLFYNNFPDPGRIFAQLTHHSRQNDHSEDHNVQSSQRG